MEFSSPRLKAFVVTFGFTFWFCIISLTLDFFSITNLIIFALGTFIITQVFASKLSKYLDLFAVFNTKVFLGLLFISLISIYGIFFKILQVDLLRLKQNTESYWLETEKSSLDYERQF